MIQVKWVHKHGFWEDEIARHDHNSVPVVPLSALAEVVEGLKEIAGEIVCDGPNCHWCIDGNTHMASPGALTAQRLLTQLEAHRKGGA